MRLQRVYVDTSVIGGCHDDEFATWSNGLMKDFRLGNFRPVVSEVVDAEVRDAPEPIGYKPLQIYSPREVTNYGYEKDV